METNIELDELVSMFRRAVKNGPCPDATILRNYPDLLSTDWASALARRDTFPQNRFVEEQLEMRKSLERVCDFLPKFVKLKQFMMKTGLPGFDHEQVDALVQLQAAITTALPYFPSSPSEGKRTANWHTVASFVAAFVAVAFLRAGRKTIGVNSSSPLVKVMQEWLGRAGIHVTPENIALGFQRGLVRRPLKPPTIPPGSL